MFTCCSSRRRFSNGVQRKDRSFHSPLSMFRRHASRTRRSNNRYSVHRLKHDLRRTLWHAFDSLSNSEGLVHRSQLKVLASSIGRALGVEKCEEYLDKHEGGADLDFPVFYEILVENVLEPLSRAPQETVQLAESDYEEVHNVCWTLCSSKTMPKRSSDLEKHLPDDLLYKLWRLFNFLVEIDDLYIPQLPLRMDKEEVQSIVRSFFQASGQMKVDIIVHSIGKDHETYSYPEFQALFEENISKDVSDKVLHHAIDTVYDEYINDTLLKGMICKRGHQVKTWKDRWMVLTAGELRYYTSSDLKDMKGCITFDDECRIEVLPEQAGHKPNRFVLHTPSKPYEMSASDIKTRNDWVSALQSVIEHCGDDSYHFHQNDFIKRRQIREQLRKLKENEERLRREEAENLRRMQQEFDDKHKQDAQLLEEQLRELEREKKEREALEAKLREEAALRELDQQRLRELEAMKEELERLLEEERQAKKDEEIVRSLQARILEEETQKREELERLKEQQEEMLEMERQKREGLEGQQEVQESLLQQAKDRLEQLEIDRMNADAKLQEAQQKLQDAEKERIKLQDKVRLWKTPNIGLARPVQPKFDPHVTHRGKGAFCENDFHKHSNTNMEHKTEGTEEEKSELTEDNNQKHPKTSHVNTEFLYERTKDITETKESQIKQSDSETLNSDENDAQKSIDQSAELSTLQKNSAENQTDLIYINKQENNDESSQSTENILPSSEIRHNEMDNRNSVMEMQTVKENDQISNTKDFEQSEKSVNECEQNKSQEMQCEVNGDEISKTFEKQTEITSADAENLAEEHIYANEETADGYNSANDEIYENEDINQGKKDSSDIENCDRYSKEVDQNVTAFDNMLYESMELKIVESGD